MVNNYRNALRIILVTFLIFQSFGVFSQESHVKVQEIGGLFADNKIGFDGGLTHLKLEILNEKVGLRSNKIKLKGQVLDQFGEPVSTIKIFLGYINEEDQLVIIDTLFAFDFEQPITIFNRKKLNENVDGIFRIKANLGDEYAIYISGAASHLLEIKIDK